MRTIGYNNYLKFRHSVSTIYDLDLLPDTPEWVRPQNRDTYYIEITLRVVSKRDPKLTIGDVANKLTTEFPGIVVNVLIVKGLHTRGDWAGDTHYHVFVLFSPRLDINLETLKLSIRGLFVKFEGPSKFTGTIIKVEVVTRPAIYLNYLVDHLRPYNCILLINNVSIPQAYLLSRFSIFLNLRDV